MMILSRIEYLQRLDGGDDTLLQDPGTLDGFLRRLGDPAPPKWSCLVRRFEGLVKMYSVSFCYPRLSVSLPPSGASTAGVELPTQSNPLRSARGVVHPLSSAPAQPRDLEYTLADCLEKWDHLTAA